MSKRRKKTDSNLLDDFRIQFLSALGLPQAYLTRLCKICHSPMVSPSDYNSLANLFLMKGKRVSVKKLLRKYFSDVQENKFGKEIRLSFNKNMEILFDANFSRDFLSFVDTLKVKHMLKALVTHFFRGKLSNTMSLAMSVRRREEEYELLNSENASEWNVSATHFRFGCVDIPSDLMIHIVNYLPRTKSLLFGLGLVNSSLFTFVLTTWTKLKMTPTNLVHISLLIFPSLEHISFVGTFDPGQLDYVFSKIQGVRLRTLDFSQCSIIPSEPDCPPLTPYSLSLPNLHTLSFSPIGEYRPPNYESKKKPAIIERQYEFRKTLINSFGVGHCLHTVEGLLPDEYKEFIKQHPDTNFKNLKLITFRLNPVHYWRLKKVFNKSSFEWMKSLPLETAKVRIVYDSQTYEQDFRSVVYWNTANRFDDELVGKHFVPFLRNEVFSVVEDLDFEWPFLGRRLFDKDELNLFNLGNLKSLRITKFDFWHDVVVKSLVGLRKLCLEMEKMAFVDCTKVKRLVCSSQRLEEVELWTLCGDEKPMYCMELFRYFFRDNYSFEYDVGQSQRGMRWSFEFWGYPYAKFRNVMNNGDEFLDEESEQDFKNYLERTVREKIGKEKDEFECCVLKTILNKFNSNNECCNVVFGVDCEEESLICVRVERKRLSVKEGKILLKKKSDYYDPNAVYTVLTIQQDFEEKLKMEFSNSWEDKHLKKEWRKRRNNQRAIVKKFWSTLFGVDKETEKSMQSMFWLLKNHVVIIKSKQDELKKKLFFEKNEVGGQKYDLTRVMNYSDKYEWYEYCYVVNQKK